jgi:hypothetical protein
MTSDSEAFLSLKKDKIQINSLISNNNRFE